jgi:hypothetical protein
MQPHAEPLNRLPRLGNVTHQRIIGRKTAPLHPVPQASEVVEVPADDGADALGLFGGEVVGGHADTVTRGGADDNR